MKTIEERAKLYSLKDFDGYYSGREKPLEEGYIAGAKEQKMIDFDKTCAWLNKKLRYASLAEVDLRALKQIAVDFYKTMGEQE